MKYYLILFCLILSYCCSNDKMNANEGEPNSDTQKKVLFIGNSHTNYNQGIPFHLKEIAESYDNEILVKKSAPGGFSFADHIEYPETLNLINSQDWDIIIIQENTFVAAYETQDMLTSLEGFKPLLDATNASIYLFKTWAYENEPNMNNLLSNAYNQVTLATGFNTINIGTLWDTFHTNYNISLYADDGYHPSIKGTYLTALLFYKKLYETAILTDCEYNALIDLEEAQIIKEFVTIESI